MKKISLVLGVLLLPALAIANPTDVKPHYDIPSEIWKYLHVDSLPVKNPKNIKSFTLIEPVYDTDFENVEGDKTNFTYNKNGLLTGGSHSYGDANGGYNFKIELNQYGHPAKIIWTQIAGCQDCSPEHEKSHTVVTEYIPFYQRPGYIQQMRATTVNAGGKKVNSVSKFMVTPGPTGAPAKLVCLEDNSIKKNFNAQGLPESYNIYKLEADYPSGKWVLQTLNPGESTYNGEVAHPDAQYEMDSHGNWIKETWIETWDDGQKVTNGTFRNIEYY